MSKIEINICPCGFTNGQFLLFDYDFYKNQIKLKNKIPNYITDTKLMMWLYYLKNKDAVAFRFGDHNDHYETYKDSIKVLFENDYSFNSFDAEQYLSLYPDVSEYCKKSPVRAFCHFIYFGLLEGRQITFIQNPRNNSDQLINIDVIIKDCLEKYKIKEHALNQLVDIFTALIEKILNNNQLNLQFYLAFKFIEDIFSIVNFTIFVNRFRSTENVDSVISVLKTKLDQKYNEIQLLAKKSCPNLDSLKQDLCNKEECHYCQLMQNYPIDFYENQQSETNQTDIYDSNDHQSTTLDDEQSIISQQKHTDNLDHIEPTNLNENRQIDPKINNITVDIVDIDDYNNKKNDY